MYKRLPITSLIPNSWNPNRVPADMLAKLQNGIAVTLEKAGKIPPIVVRPAPTKGEYEIIDGYHRWTVLKKLDQEEVDAFIVDVDDAMARVLTAALNYVKGEMDPEKYPDLIAETLLADKTLTLDALSKILPESKDQLLEIVTSSDDAMAKLKDLIDTRSSELAEGGVGEEQDPDQWVTLNFTVPLSVAEAVEKELDRIGDVIEGKNKRTRALEYMAVLSAQTPLDTVTKKEALTKKQEERKATVAPVSKKPASPPKKVARA